MKEYLMNLFADLTYEGIVDYNQEKIKSSLKYRLYIPKDYDACKSYPLVLFLHGAGERGSDNHLHLDPRFEFLPLITNEENLKKYPCIIFAPQCPSNNSWVDVNYRWNYHYDLKSTPISINLQLVLQIMDQLIANYNIDIKRLYVTGFSMGGFATWDLISRFPNKFACALPVCGGNDPLQAETIKNNKIWTFHGDLDPIVGVHLTRNMVEALKKVNGNIRYSEYHGVLHNAWTYAYKEVDLLEFMFSSKLK